MFFISAAFQSGNNLGVAAAIDVFTESKTLVPCLVIAFNLMAITFLFAFKNLYRILERLMMFLVAMMLISFAINLIVLRPNLADLLMGFIPFAQSTDSATTKTEGLDGLISLLGLIGTTFVITAAFYQSYLVRQKGWDEKQVESGIVDARVGAVIMTLITVMLVSTAAAGLYDGSYIELANPIQVADELEPTFGTLGKYIFSLGLFSAAFSSFLVNSMIGGFIVSDCLGYSSDPHDRAPKIMTTVALLTGMVVALAALILDLDIAPTIIAAQAVTVVGAPLIAGVLLWLASSKDIMGSHAARPATITFATVGLVVLIAIAANTAINTVPTKIRNYINKNTEQQSNDTTDPAPATPAKD